MANPIPPGTTSITPHLIVRNAPAALDFYARAFGATEVLRMQGPDGSIVHAEIQIGNARVYLAEENQQMGAPSPQSLGGSAVLVMHYVDRVDDVFKNATDAGAKPVTPPMDMFWGDRWSLIEDPFGHKWEIATHLEDLTPAQIQERAKAARPAHS